ncbi:MAG: hypothetical protein ACYDBB_27270 [Armatimonadota bacterium]
MSSLAEPAHVASDMRLLLGKQALSLGPAAALIGVSRQTLNSWCNAADLGRPSPLKHGECWKPGRNWRISVEAVERLRSTVDR